MENVAAFVANLLHSATVAHLMHLATPSYSAHKALRSFYRFMPELADNYAEAWMGRYGKITDWPQPQHAETDPVAFMASLSEFVAQSREHLPTDPDLSKIVDDVGDLISRTLYRLRFLT